jgi:copper chaperone CopZ
MAIMQVSMQMAELEIRGLTPGSASRGVCSALESIRGVQHVDSEPDARRVTVIFDAFRVSPLQFETAVRVMGCDVERLIIQTPENMLATKASLAQDYLS